MHWLYLPRLKMNYYSVQIIAEWFFRWLRPFLRVGDYSAYFIHHPVHFLFSLNIFFCGIPHCFYNHRVGVVTVLTHFHNEVRDDITFFIRHPAFHFITRWPCQGAPALRYDPPFRFLLDPDLSALTRRPPGLKHNMLRFTLRQAINIQCFSPAP